MESPLDKRAVRYAETVLEFSGDPGFRIDLREPLSDEAMERLDEWGIPTPFAVITACNPVGGPPSAELDEERHGYLERTLTERGASFREVTGLSPDGHHREVGFGVQLPRDEAIRLARVFDQFAIFWFDGEIFRIAWSDPSRRDVRLPVKTSEATAPEK